MNDGVISNVSCSMYDPSVDAKYFHSLVMPTLAVTLLTPFTLTAVSTIFCTNACLSSVEIDRVLLQRRRPVLGIGRHRRELHVHFLRHRAGLGHFGGDAGDPLDFGLADDGAAGKAPDAAVNHADAKAGRAAVARPPRPPPPRPPPPKPRPPPPNPPAASRSGPPLAFTPLLTLRVKRMSA